jgi:hypothetical protein
MFHNNMVRSALVVAAALAAVSTTNVAGVASAATPLAIGTVAVTNVGAQAGAPVPAETVKKGARITGADRSKLAGELTAKY